MTKHRHPLRHTLRSFALALCSLGAVTALAQPAKLPAAPPGSAVATFAGGCFWCMEPPFDKLPGVVSTTVRLHRRHEANPTYERGLGGGTGHAEAMEVIYDPRRSATRSCSTSSGTTSTRRSRTASSATSASSTARRSSSTTTRSARPPRRRRRRSRRRKPFKDADRDADRRRRATSGRPRTTTRTTTEESCPATSTTAPAAAATRA